MVLDSPVLTNKEWTLLQSHFGEIAAEIDCTYADGPDALRHAIARVRQEAEQAVREGRTEIFLTDENIGTDRVAFQMILAAEAVKTQMVTTGLRLLASVQVPSTDDHHPQYLTC